MCEFEIRGKKLCFGEELIKEYEVICMKIINHNILCCSGYDFIKFFLGIGVIMTNDCIKKKSESQDYEDSNFSKCFSSIENSNLKSITSPTFYTGPFVDKICVLSYNVLDSCTDGKIFLI